MGYIHAYFSLDVQGLMDYKTYMGDWLAYLVVGFVIFGLLFW